MDDGRVCMGNTALSMAVKFNSARSGPRWNLFDDSEDASNSIQYHHCTLSLTGTTEKAPVDRFTL